MLMSVLTAISSSCDSFICGFTLGLNNIRFSRKNALILSIFPLLFSFASILIGKYVSPYCSVEIKESVSIFTYLILALYTFNEQRKMTLKKWQKKHEWVDNNHDLSLTLVELIPLALVLSVDSLIIALPIAFYDVSPYLVAALFGIFNYISIRFGYLLSKKLKMLENSRVLSFSWVLFILLALSVAL